MALNRSDKSRILRRYFPGMTRNSEMSTEPRLVGCIPGELQLRLNARYSNIGNLRYC